MKNQIQFVNVDVGASGQVADCYLCEGEQYVRKATQVLEIFNEQLGWVTFRAVCNKHKKLAVKYMRGDD